jgi:methylated-DNA-[protein]-cysteine S-methyltransferase
MTRVHSRMESPVGPLLLLGHGCGPGSGPGPALTAVLMDLQARDPDPGRIGTRDDAALAPARDQLEAYFAGTRQAFDLVVAGAGTPFQRRVWAELCRIPFGSTITYGELARRIGQPTASRAVGLANGQNRLAIVVPCHRVVGAGGALTGYAGGIERKRWLLDHERRQGVLF